ncbi:pyridoxal phosphate-dependent decarboxylase family protein [Flavilitoribacter nigricans]|uniref:Amino acid decarboxylase n=1 Tax=Flavilitoribacter nigricans (strain ATCC 23147 / DSM 23189 / NBRC 102662 / NCIMB 1420 / SS-2) TaxID=1122177 RepID=A0A2D0N215_FLAN2|nr:aminotransferase class I/II-fold pyridoxal phosphate-dependent enzyme [Flavilitoribacter nigricans]PHN02497.1 amino acid decarboxylase [Flavilitoribacter nigricans DSM 23189 = NBRC 102662]
MFTIKTLIDDIDRHEAISRALEIPATERDELQRAVLAYGEAFLESLPARKTYEKAGYRREAADDFFTIDGEAIQMGPVLDFLDQRVDHGGLNPTAAGHLAYIPGGGLYASALGDYLAAVTNRYAGVFYAAPGAVRMENALINWVAQLVGYAPGFAGNLTSGGSIANLIAVATARDAKQIRGKDLHRTVIYASGQTHHSIRKALKIAGMEECIFRTIEQDEHYRMDPKQLREQIRKDQEQDLQPFLVVANAGTTDLGIVDPLEAIARIAREYELWFHVDAAYGGFFLLTAHGRDRLRGIDRADSVILDPHKGLFLPYGSGVVLVRDGRQLAAANRFEAHYMQDAREFQEEPSPTDLSPELSKHFRGMRMWLPLKLHGLAPFISCLEEKLGLAQYFYRQIRELGFETGPAPDLTVVAFRYVPADGPADDFNRTLLQKIQTDGRIFLSSTLLNGRFMLRVAILSFRTHRVQVDLALQLLGEYRDGLLAGKPSNGSLTEE